MTRGAAVGSSEVTLAIIRYDHNPYAETITLWVDRLLDVPTQIIEKIFTEGPYASERRKARRTLPGGGLDQKGLLKWEEVFLDGRFARRKMGLCRRKTTRGKG
jgi:hypothetical protein